MQNTSSTATHESLAPHGLSNIVSVLFFFVASVFLCSYLDCGKMFPAWSGTKALFTSIPNTAAGHRSSGTQEQQMKMLKKRCDDMTNQYSKQWMYEVMLQMKEALLKDCFNMIYLLGSRHKVCSSHTNYHNLQVPTVSRQRGWETIQEL